MYLNFKEDLKVVFMCLFVLRVPEYCILLFNRCEKFKVFAKRCIFDLLQNKPKSLVRRLIRDLIACLKAKITAGSVTAIGEFLSHYKVLSLVERITSSLYH